VCWPHDSLYAKTMSLFQRNLPSIFTNSLMLLILQSLNTLKFCSTVSPHIHCPVHVQPEALLQSHHKSTGIKSHFSVKYFVSPPVSYVHTLEHTSHLNTSLICWLLLCCLHTCKVQLYCIHALISMHTQKVGRVTHIMITAHRIWQLCCQKISLKERIITVPEDHVKW
jgi:hypothetical protein